MVEDPRAVVVELCRHFYFQGWCTGTGGGMSVRDGERIYLAPSAVQKERLKPEDIFVLGLDGEVIEPPADPGLRQSQCKPLFFNAFVDRDAGAVLHSHGQNAMLVTLLFDDCFEITHVEMMKGLRGVGFHDTVRVPIIDNTAHERDLADRMARAMAEHPGVDAVLVRRHGVYVWGRDWQHAKTQAECYDYLFAAAINMKKLGLDPTAVPPGCKGD